MAPNRTILYATDFSECSNQAFELACALARNYGARLIVLHVRERLAPMPPAPLGPEERQALWDTLQRIKPPEPTVRVEYLLEEGDPATAILRVA
jgi:nucleotide-binding universal stress UspA family protein